MNPMNQMEIFAATHANLKRRLKEICDPETLQALPGHSGEARLIRSELARRVGCCV